jgi:hypothetical protein
MTFLELLNNPLFITGLSTAIGWILHHGIAGGQGSVLIPGTGPKQPPANGTADVLANRPVLAGIRDLVRAEVAAFMHDQPAAPVDHPAVTVLKAGIDANASPDALKSLLEAATKLITVKAA